MGLECWELKHVESWRTFSSWWRGERHMRDETTFEVSSHLISLDYSNPPKLDQIDLFTLRLYLLPWSCTNHNLISAEPDKYSWYQVTLTSRLNQDGESQGWPLLWSLTHRSPPNNQSPPWVKAPMSCICKEYTSILVFAREKHAHMVHVKVIFLVWFVLVLYRCNF